MKIEGPNFNNYNPQHLPVVRREVPHSIKPNLFREVEETIEQALRYKDLVNLSPEARALLKKLKRQMAGESTDSDLDEAGVEHLIYTLRELRELVYARKESGGEHTEQAPTNGKKPSSNGSQAFSFNPPVLQLGVALQGGRGGGRGDGPLPSGSHGIVREIIERMTVYSPSDKTRLDLCDELGVLGEKMVDTVSRFGVKVIVLEPNRAITDLRLAGMSVVAPSERTFDGRPWSGVRGLYDQSRRIIVIGQEKLGKIEQSAARHEFAHAFDHTFTVRHSRRQPLSVQLWNLFAEQRRGLVTQYAATNPAEYWAESVESFFKPNGRERVRQCDPQMYQYLETLFAS